MQKRKPKIFYPMQLVTASCSAEPIREENEKKWNFSKKKKKKKKKKEKHGQECKQWQGPVGSQTERDQTERDGHKVRINRTKRQKPFPFADKILKLDRKVVFGTILCNLFCHLSFLTRKFSILVDKIKKQRSFQKTHRARITSPDQQTFSLVRLKWVLLKRPPVHLVPKGQQ